MTTVTVYSRQGCHLCDDAKNVLESLREELNFEIEDGEFRIARKE